MGIDVYSVSWGGEAKKNKAESSNELRDDGKGEPKRM